jgi:hypothetical protein
MYQLTNTTSILRADGVSIPNDPLNSDYAAYLQWLDAGNIAAPASPALIQTPKEVTMRQARELMIDLGILDTVNAAIAGMTGIAGKKAQNFWEKSQVVQRANPLVSTMGALLGWNAAQLDAYFLSASKL